MNAEERADDIVTGDWTPDSEHIITANEWHCLKNRIAEAIKQAEQAAFEEGRKEGWDARTKSAERMLGWVYGLCAKIRGFQSKAGERVEEEVEEFRALPLPPSL